MAVNVKRTLRDIRMGRMMAYGAETKAEGIGDMELYRKISENAWREVAEAEEMITDKLQLLTVMDRLIVEQWLDGATFREIAAAINWSMKWTNYRFNAAVKQMQQAVDQQELNLNENVHTALDTVLVSSNKNEIPAYH